MIAKLTAVLKREICMEKSLREIKYNLIMKVARTIRRTEEIEMSPVAANNTA
jgi:hypothetical protein